MEQDISYLSNFRKKSGSKRHFFTQDEDKMLIFAVDNWGFDWKKASEYIGGVSSRQCRDRYKTYLDPSIITSEWTIEEDKKLILLYNEIGPRWKEMTKILNGRSDNSIKNRWNETLSKKVRWYQPSKSIFGISFEQISADLNIIQNTINENQT